MQVFHGAYIHICNRNSSFVEALHARQKITLFESNCSLSTNKKTLALLTFLWENRNYGSTPQAARGKPTLARQ